MIDIIEKATMQTTHRLGWQIVCVDYANTHAHIKNDIAKTHGLATWSAYRYLREKTLKIMVLEQMEIIKNEYI